MRIFKSIFAAGALVAGLSGCATNLIQIEKGSESVTLADAQEVRGCQPKGKVTVSVLAKVGFVTRAVQDIDADLLQLAKNGAVDAGGDTVVKGDRPELGTRTFSIYKCRP